MKEENYNIEDRGKPIFHMGRAFLERLNDNLRLCDQFSIAGDHVMWKRTLKVIFRNISHYLTEEEKNLLSASLANVYSNPKPMSKKDQIMNLEGLESLDAIDEYLKRIIHEKGLIMPSKDDPGQAMMR